MTQRLHTTQWTSLDLCSVNFSIVFVTMLHTMQSLKATRKYHPHDTPTHIGILYQAYANARIATPGMTGLDLEECLCVPSLESVLVSPVRRVQCRRVSAKTVLFSE